MNNYRFAGYGITEFSPATENSLKLIAERLIPYQDLIIDTWISRQWKAWQPPGITQQDLYGVFSDVFRRILSCMQAAKLDVCLTELEDAGRELAAKKFPFQALIISVHYLEESYMKFLLEPGSEKNQKFLIAMDEFLHSVLAALATSYFNAYRTELLEQAEIGRIVQESLITDIPKRSDDLDIAHVYISANEKAQLGGDFLDYFKIDETGTAFIIGDFSGHGLEAASDSLMLRSWFRAFMREKPDLSDAMERVNEALSTELDSDQFATALAMEYDISGKLNLVSAGHPYPILCRKDSCGVLELSSYALTVIRGIKYTAHKINLEPGDLFIAYTDGLIEAGDPSNQFGEERVVDIVRSMRDSSTSLIAHRLIDEAKRHAGGEFEDDVAVLVLKRRV